MPDPRVVNHARILVDYSANVQPGETVGIVTTTLAQPLVEAIYERVLERGGFPVTWITIPRLQEILLRVGNPDQLKRPPFLLQVGALDHLDHVLNIGAAENTRHAGSADPVRLGLIAESQRDMGARWMERLMQPTHSVTVALHPTPAQAQEAGMSVLDYEDFVYRACLVDAPDPVAAWQAIGERQERLRQYLLPKSTLHVQGPHIDLHLSVAGRDWMNDDGHKNMPGGELFTSPIEDSATGHIHFTYPAFYQGREVRDIQLWFERGEVVRAEAASGAEFLHRMLDMDPGARRLGEFAIGTNIGITRVTGHVLFDEKIGGTCHIALGRGFPNLGGRNTSAIHWDIVCDLKTDTTITADGHTFYRDGALLL